MPPVEHLSYSSISTYVSCPRSWRFRYVDRIQTPRSVALVFGSAFHDAVEALIADKAADPAEAWGAAWRGQLTAEEINAIDWGADTPESVSNDGLRLLADPEILATVRSIKPLHIEKSVSLSVPGVPIPVIGFVDVITEHGPADFKTSAKAWTPDRAAEEMQPVFYLAALNQEGYPLKDLTFTHYVFVKTPRVQVLKTQRHFSEMFWLFGMIADVWTGIERGVYPPNPTTWRCSPRYCEYWAMCRGKA